MNQRQSDLLQRILDHQLKLDGETERRQTANILASEPEARRLQEAVEKMLKPLRGWQDVEVPEGLSARTLQFIAQHEQAQTMAQASAAIAAQRHPTDQPKPLYDSRGRWIMNNFWDIFAVAATLLIAFVLMQPGVERARKISRQVACANNFHQVNTAFNNYARDNAGMLPVVNHRPGDPWFRVGAAGDRNESNTRNVWLLVKNQYIPARAFICPGVKNQPAQIQIQLTPDQMKMLQDFAGREQINYSFRLMFIGPQNMAANQPAGLALGSDQNPLFRDFHSSPQPVLDLAANQDLLRQNSPNHAGAGQNVLCNDGRVLFTPDRHIGPAADDAFTIQSVQKYTGTELPQTADDVFIAP